MKKLYQGKGRRVHPAPPPAPDAALALLPAALLALAATLTQEEQEVLAYLLSGIGTGGSSGAAAAGGRRTAKRHNGPHQPDMGCGCFGCYKSYWARWDASPNRHLIHRIIDAVEEGSSSAAAANAGPSTRRGGQRRRRRGGRAGHALDAAAAADAPLPDACRVDLQPCCASDGGGEDGDYEGDDDDGADSVYAEDEALTDDSDCSASASAEKSAVGKLVRFIGEKVWAAWT